MSIEKYLKSTPDQTVTNTVGASTDGQNLKLYKLSNAGENIGLEWCYSTNFNNTNFIDNSYIRTGIDSADTAKTGVTCPEILPLANGKFVGKIDDSNVTWDKIKGLAFGVIYFNQSDMRFDNAYICSNLDYSRLVINTSAWDSSADVRRYLEDELDAACTDGYRAKLQSITTGGDIINLDNFYLAYATIGDDGLPVIQIYGATGVSDKYELQVGSRWWQTGFVDGYKNQVHEYPYYSNMNYMFRSLLKITHNDKYRKIFTLPHTKQALLFEQTVWSTQYGQTYATSYMSSVDVQSWIRFMNATGLRYYDGVAFTTLNDIKANMYMGIMDDDGITDCDSRIKGWDEIEASDLPNKDRNGYDWDVVDPTKPPAPEPTDDDIESVGYGYFSNTALGTLCALKNKLDIAKISQWLLTQTEGIDVAKNIVSIKEIPFPLSTLGLQPLDIPLTIGGHNVTYGGSDLIVGEIVAPTIPTLNIVFADFDIPRLSNTYLDYNPYTKYELLLPFAPSPITLPDWVIEKNVKAIFLYDIYTTACQYIIICNNERICAVSGTFGIDRAIAAQNVALRDSARLSAQLGTASSVIGGVISGAVGNINGVASGAIGGISAINQYINAGKQNYMYTIGANSDSSSVGLYHAAHLKITRTLSIEDESYNHTYGRPLCKTRQLSNVSGFTICGNADTSSINTATTAERNAIQQLLTSGVYL